MDDDLWMIQAVIQPRAPAGGATEKCSFGLSPAFGAD